MTMHELVVALMMWAGTALGVPAENMPPPPVVKFVSERTLFHMTFPGREYAAVDGQWEVAGAYRPGTVYLRNGFDQDNPKDRSVLGHEVVHHLQDWALTKQARSECKGDHEREGYDVQEKYLAEHDITLTPTDDGRLTFGLPALVYVFFVSCPNSNLARPWEPGV